MKTLPFIGLIGLILGATSQAESVPLSHDNPLATFHSVEIPTTDGLELQGQLALPRRNSAPFPAVLLISGSGPNNRYEGVPAGETVDGKPALLFQGIESALLAQGIAVMTYDKRGVTPRDETFLVDEVSKSTLQTASFEQLFLDAISAYEVLVALPNVDTTRIGVLGHSEGAIIATRIAERYPELRAIFELGVMTGSFADDRYYQTVVNGMRVFQLMDADRDGYLTEKEWNLFKEASEATGFASWTKTLSELDQTGDGRISEQECRFYLENIYRNVESLIWDETLPWKLELPRKWFQQFETFGPLLPHHLKVCQKLHVFQGELDIQTPFEDALELREECLKRGSPLASFRSYPELGHGFSPRIGYLHWKNTIGPMSPEVSRDIGTQAAEAFFP